LAGKRFSRLSILLEARDRMTRPMQNASRASSQLQRNMNALNGQTGQNSSGFNRVTNSVKNAYTGMIRYSQSVIRASKNSALAYLATQSLKGSLKLMTLVVNGTRMAFRYLGSAILDAVRNTRLFRAGARAYDVVKTSVKGVTVAILNALRITKMWNATLKFIRTTKNDIRILNDMFKQSASRLKQNVVNTIKNTAAYKAMTRATQGLRNKIVSARIAMELFKNSSTFVAKLKNDAATAKRGFEVLGRGIKSLIPKFETLRRNIENANRGLHQTGSRRATFNQLADANARLNRELARMNRNLDKGNSKLSQMRSSIGHLNGMGAAFGLAYAGQAAYGTGERIVEGTVGTAMEQNYSQASVGILAGADKGAAYWKQIQEYAASTAYSAEDWARNMRGAISKSKTVKELEVYQNALEQLATLDPIQGLDGAALAIRELNSGDIVSLVERFELPRQQLKEIKAIADPIKQIKELMKIVGKETGYTLENIAQMKELPLMQWQKMTNSVKTMFGYIGSGALEKIAPLMKKFNMLWDSGKLKPFIDWATKGFANLAEKAINFATKLANGIDMSSIKEKYKPFLDLFNNIKSTIQEAWPTISAILDNARTILGHVADEINTAWPTANTLLQDMLTVVKDVSGWIANNWPQTVSIIGGVAAAFGAFHVLSAVASGFSLVTKAIKLYQAGTLLATIQTWALNTALLANPIVAVIAAVVGLVAACVLLYKNFDVVKEKVDNMWKKVKEWGLGMKNAMTEVFYIIKMKVNDTINSIIDKINTMIKKINNIPGVKIPIIPQVKEPVMPASMIDATLGVEPTGPVTPKSSGGTSWGTGHHGGLNYVPYDGYQARLHKGEAVLTNQERKERDSKQQAAGVIITGNNFVVRNDSDIDSIAEALFQKLYKAQTATG
jgi:hypothetical protein